jgi:hypothetical protein
MYSYQNSPNYDPRSPAISDASNSPHHNPFFYGYGYQYPCPPAPYFGPLPTTEQYSALPNAYHPGADSQTTEGNDEPEDRSATPIPPRPTPVVDGSVEVQQ